MSPLVVLAVAAGAAPFLGYLVRTIVERPEYVFGGDQALIELATGDAATGTRWEGPYSRYQWNHPGPAWFYLLAFPYRLLGSEGWTLVVAVLLLHAVCAAAVVLVAARIGGPFLALVCAALVLAWVRSVGLELFAFPWNPWALFLPLCLLVLVACSGLGSPAARLVAVAVLGSLLIQIHVGVAPTVLAVAGGVLVVEGWRFRRSGASLREGWVAARRPVLTGATLLGVLWLLPVIDQFAHRPGNLTELLRWARDSGGGPGWGDAVRIVSADLGRFPHTAGAFVDAEEGVRSGPPVAVLLYVALGVFLVGAGRRAGNRFAAGVGVTTLVVLPVAVLSVTRIVPPVLDWLHAWVAVLAVPVWLALAHLLWVWAGPRFPGAVSAAAAVGAVVMALVLMRPVLDRPVPVPSHPGVIAAWDLVHPALAADAGPDGQRVLVRIAEAGRWPIATGLVLRMERNGVDTRVTDDWVYMFGSEYEPEGDADLELILDAADNPLPEEEFAGAQRLGQADGTDLWLRPRTD